MCCDGFRFLKPVFARCFTEHTRFAVNGPKHSSSLVPLRDRLMNLFAHYLRQVDYMFSVQFVGLPVFSAELREKY